MSRTVTLYHAYFNEYDKDNPIRVVSVQAHRTMKNYVVSNKYDSPSWDLSLFQVMVGKHIPLDSPRVHLTRESALTALQRKLEQDYMDLTDSVTNMDRALRKLAPMISAVKAGHPVIP